VFVSPTVAGDAVIIGSCAGTLYALDRATGDPIWFYDANGDGSAVQFHGEPLLLGERVVVATDGDPTAHLYSFDIASGDLQWKVPFKSGVATTPLLVDDRVVVVSAQGEVAAVDAQTGNVLWRVMPAGALESIPYIPSPAHAANRILVADNKNQIFALDAKDGSTVWRKTLSARPNTSLAVIGDSVVVGTEDRYLHWIAIDSGDSRQRVQLPGIPHGTPILAARLLFVLTTAGTGNLLALDAQSGEIRWKQETPEEWTTYRPLVTPTAVIVGNQEKNLCSFDRASGVLRWCRPAGQIPRGLGISPDGRLYVGSRSGIVQAFPFPAE